MAQRQEISCNRARNRKSSSSEIPSCDQRRGQPRILGCALGQVNVNTAKFAPGNSVHLSCLILPLLSVTHRRMVSTTRNLVVLFADISGSTKLYEFLGNSDALATIDRCLSIVKRVCVDFDGRVVKTIGDEVLAVFPAADSAAQAAIEIQLRICKQRTSRDDPVAMHIGFHSGPTIEDGSDVFGDAVNVAARLTAFATGGQIFTSAQTAAELSPALRARTRDQDSHTLRGKEQDVAMFELTWAESEEELTSMSPRVALAPAKVKLTHGAREIELGEARSRLTLGRDIANDVGIADSQ